MVIQGDEDMMEAYAETHDIDEQEAFEDWASNTEPEPVEMPDIYDREDMTHEQGEDN